MEQATTKHILHNKKDTGQEDASNKRSKQSILGKLSWIKEIRPRVLNWNRSQRLFRVYLIYKMPVLLCLIEYYVEFIYNLILFKKYKKKRKKKLWVAAFLLNVNGIAICLFLFLLYILITLCHKVFFARHKHLVWSIE